MARRRLTTSSNPQLTLEFNTKMTFPALELSSDSMLLDDCRTLARPRSALSMMVALGATTKLLALGNQWWYMDTNEQGHPE